MGLFTTQAAWQAKCDGLQARIDELEADALAHDGAVTALQTELAEAKEANASFPSEDVIAKLTKERDDAFAAAGPATVSLLAMQILNGTAGTDEQKADAQRLIASRVTEQLAAVGHQGPVEDTGDANPVAKTKTRAEFDALSHPERNAFLRSGGKVTA